MSTYPQLIHTVRGKGGTGSKFVDRPVCCYCYAVFSDDLDFPEMEAEFFVLKVFNEPTRFIYPSSIALAHIGQVIIEMFIVQEPPVQSYILADQEE